MVDRILKKVEAIIDYYKTRNPFELCDEMGILVIDSDLPESVNGIYTMLYGQNTILLNKRLSEIKRHIVCAHELGHVILHERLNCLDLERNTNFSVPRLETEADTFAACLIIDTNLLKGNF